MFFTMDERSGWEYTDNPTIGITVAGNRVMKRDRAFIPLIGLSPSDPQYIVVGGNQTLYTGNDPEQAKSAKDLYWREHSGHACIMRPYPTLNRHQFQVVRTGTDIAIRAGEDETDRLLLLSAYEGEERHKPAIYSEHTTAQILYSVHSRIIHGFNGLCFAALFNVGEVLTIGSEGVDVLMNYAWDGVELMRVKYVDDSGVVPSHAVVVHEVEVL